MGLLAAVIAYFVARLMFSESTRGGHARAGWGALAFTLVLPPVLYGIFRITSPPGSPASGAFIPAMWVGLLMGGITVGIFLAAKHSNNRPPPRKP